MLLPRARCSRHSLCKQLHRVDDFVRLLSSNSKRPPSSKSATVFGSNKGKDRNDGDPASVDTKDENSTSNKKADVRRDVITVSKSRSPLSYLKVRPTSDVKQLPRTLEQATKDAETRRSVQQRTDEEKIVGADVARAVSNVSDILGGQNVKSDLLQRLVDIERETFHASKPAGGDPTSGQKMAGPKPKRPPAAQRVTTKDAAQQQGASSSTGLADTLRSMAVSKAKPPPPPVREKRLSEYQPSDDLDRQLTEAKDLLNKMGVTLNVQRGIKSPTFAGVGRKKRMPDDDSPVEYEFIDFLSGPRLNLYHATPLAGTDTLEAAPDVKEDKTLLPVWDKWRVKHLAWMSNAAPRNGFEEMIEWTKQGKMHPYPIDNEYGFHEKFIPFHEHVFLNRLLTDDDRVPQSGPVREFLDLVCNGLSKNPYMRLERKAEHIEWYKEYFKNKIAEIEHLKINEDNLRMKL